MRCLINTAFLLVATTSRGADTNDASAPLLAVTNLLGHEAKYLGKRVDVTGYFLFSLYHSRISQDRSDTATNAICIHPWQVQSENEEKVRTVSTGKARVIGTFGYHDRKTGHTDMCATEISKLELFEPLELTAAEARLAVTNFAQAQHKTLNGYQEPDTRFDTKSGCWFVNYWDNPPSPGGFLLFMVDRAGNVRHLPGE